MEEPRTQETAESPEAEPESYLGGRRGLTGWLGSVDHKRIGVMYLVAVLAALLLGVVFGLLLRIELAAPGKTVVGPDTYNQLFTLHGSILIFLVLVPAIPAALGNFVLPLQLGISNVAFPRLNRASFHLWAAGAGLMLLTLFLGAFDTGTAFQAPYSIETHTYVTPAALGTLLLGASTVMTGINFLVTIHECRPASTGWFQLPLNVWALYATSVAQILATPVLALTLVLLIAERSMGIGLFDPTLGGNPVLFEHFFWFAAHTAVFITIVPAMGVVSELVSTFSRKPIFGYRTIVYSSLSLAAMGFFAWGQHLVVGGQSRMASMIFSALSFAVGIPCAVIVGSWIATLYKGSIRLTTPMLYALSFVILFAVGGLSGLFLGNLTTGTHLSGTQFAVAQLHYTLMGGTLVAFLGALHYWWPKLFGRLYSESIARITAIVVFVGINLAFLPLFVAGARGMPRRSWDYDPAYAVYQQVATVGALLLGAAVVAMVFYFLRSLLFGERAPANPWGASTLEWETGSPPPAESFARPPMARELYCYDDLEYAPEVGGYVRSSSGAGDSAVPRAPAEARAPTRIASARLGMWLLAVTAILFFSGLFVAYVVFRSSHPDLFAYGQRYLDLTSGAAGVVLLIVSSLAAAWAVRAAQVGQRGLVSAFTGAALLAIVAFLGVRGIEYGQLASQQTLWGVKFDPCASPDGTELPCLSRLASEPEPTAPETQPGVAPDETTAEGSAAPDETTAAGSAAPTEPDRKKAAEQAEARLDSLLALAEKKREALPPDQVPPANTGLFFAVYFGMTGLHALFAIAGIIALLWLLRLNRRRRLGPEDYAPVDGAGMYVHLVTVLSLFLFGFLYLMH